MKHTKLTAGLLTAVLSCSLLLPVPAQAAGLSFAELREKFPDGKYWNHDINGENDPDGWTDTPCDHGTKTKCNLFFYKNMGGMQCFGFALKVTYDLYGESCYYWPQDKDLSTIKPGDSLRLYNDGHSIVVQAIEGDVIHYVDCNNGNTCIISWERTITMDTAKKNLTYIAHAPYEAPQTPEDIDTTGDADSSGEVNASDAARILMASAAAGVGGSSILTAAQEKAADVNKDGHIDASDASCVLMYAAMRGAGTYTKGMREYMAERMKK